MDKPQVFSAPDEALFADLVGREFLDYIFEKAPQKVGSRIGKALDHFAKAVKLESVDEEMGAIRLIAAEEELVVAIFELLKLNADKMPEHGDFIRKYKNHYVKLALHPVLSQMRVALGYIVEQGITMDGLEEAIHWKMKPVLFDGKVVLQMIDNDGKEIIKHNPLSLAVSREDMTDDEIVGELFKDFEKETKEHQMTVREFVSARADYRNQILYAQDGGYTAMADSLKSLIGNFKTTYRDLLWVLAVLLGNDPPNKSWGLVKQSIALYRRVLAGSNLI